MAPRPLTPYSDLAVILDNLPWLLRETRRARQLHLWQVAEQTGISLSTVHRIERGSTGYHMKNVAPLLRWIDQPPPPKGETNGEVQPGIPGLHGQPGVGDDPPVEAAGS